MQASRCGISPIVSSVVLLLMVVGMAIGAVTFLYQGQETVTGETEQVRLETVNVTCTPDQITWWINNTGETPVGGRANVFVTEAGGVNASLSRTGLVVDAGFTRASGSGVLNVSLPERMAVGQEYSLQLAMGDARLSSACRVGGGWWDPEWTYRRVLQLDTGSDIAAEVVLDAEELVDNGKMRSDCADLRGVKEQEVVPYRVTFCNPDGTARVRMNLSGARPGQVYLYYGNLQAGSEGRSLVDEGVVSTELGPEERVNLP